MDIKQSYGKEIVNALRESGVRVDIHFNYSDLPVSKKDVACRALINSCTYSPTECIPGCAEFGDGLAKLFWLDPIMYIATLRMYLKDYAKAVHCTLKECADLLDCEATLRAGIDAQQSLSLLVNDPHEYKHRIELAFINYLGDSVQEQIEDVLKEVVCH